MKRFVVHRYYTCCIDVPVEAEDADAAINRSYELINGINTTPEESEAYWGLFEGFDNADFADAYAEEEE